MTSMYGGLRAEGMKSKGKLIGLSGPARSGKDTVAGYIFDAHLIAFANPIRDALRGMLNLNDEHFHGALKEVSIDYLGKSPRQLMQLLGIEWGRGLVKESIWRDIAKKEIEEALKFYYTHVVVTDVRFEDEATMIRSMGGQIWHIEREQRGQVASHASEAGIIKQARDVVIYNNGTLAQLRKIVSNAQVKVPSE